MPRLDRFSVTGEPGVVASSGSVRKLLRLSSQVGHRPGGHVLEAVGDKGVQLSAERVDLGRGLTLGQRPSLSFSLDILR